MSRPELAVVLPTRDRADLLDRCLASIAAQTLERDRFEVVVVDDGSRDGTREVLARWNRALPLRGLRQAPSGASAARNLGIFASVAPILLFFDDDEIAAADLLQRHLDAHARLPAPNQAVLGHTTWEPGLTVTPFMHYVTDIGCFLFSYPHLSPEKPLEFHHFWTGRISVKRHFLVHHGVFSSRLRRLEDIELGFRLSRRGLEIRYEPAARSFVPETLSLEEYCRRREIDGAALVDLQALHAHEAAISAYCALAGAAERWRAVSGKIDATRREAADLERELSRHRADDADPRLRRLWSLYEVLILASRDRGILRALGSLR